MSQLSAKMKKLLLLILAVLFAAWLFLQGRVFALLGYELVEGTMDNGRINELRRVNYAPL